MDWLKSLGKDDKGSRPRCVLMTNGSREEVAQRLTELVSCTEVSISANDYWIPSGKESVAEAELGNPRRLNGLVSSNTHRLLQNWWLAVSARTPSWDIASTCAGERSDRPFAS